MFAHPSQLLRRTGYGGREVGRSMFDARPYKSSGLRTPNPGRAITYLKRRGQLARRKGEPSKVELAWELRSQMTMPLAWIAERLNMGS
jgi:hypothetical protein